MKIVKNITLIVLACDILLGMFYINLLKKENRELRHEIECIEQDGVIIDTYCVYE